MRNFTYQFHRTSHFCTAKFRSLRNFAGHFCRSRVFSQGADQFHRVISQGLRKFLNPLTFTAKLFFSIFFSFPKPANLCNAGSHHFLFVPSNFQQNLQRQPRLESLCVGTPQFPKLSPPPPPPPPSPRFLSSPYQPFIFGPFIHK